MVVFSVVVDEIQVASPLNATFRRIEQNGKMLSECQAFLREIGFVRQK
jgi:hypothetical protein